MSELMSDILRQREQEWNAQQAEALSGRPLLKAYDQFLKAPTRAAIAELQAGHGLAGATPAFMNQFGNPDTESVPSYKEIQQTAGVPNTALSDVAPSLYGGFLQKGGVLDPTLSGVAGVGLDLATDPMSYEGMLNMGQESRLAHDALSADNAAAKEAVNARAASKMPIIVPETESAAPFTGLSYGLPKDEESLVSHYRNTLNRQAFDEYMSSGNGKHDIPPGGLEPVKSRRMTAEEITNANRRGPSSDIPQSLDSLRDPTRIRMSDNGKDAEVISLKDALERRNAKSKLTKEDLIKKAIKDSKQVVEEKYNAINPDRFDLAGSGEKETPKVLQFPMNKVRDPKVDPLPPGVDPEEYQAYRESPYANEYTFTDAKNKAIEEAVNERTKKSRVVADKLEKANAEPKDFSGADNPIEQKPKVLAFDQKRVSPGIDQGQNAEMISDRFPNSFEQKRDMGQIKAKDIEEKAAQRQADLGISNMQDRILARFGDNPPKNLVKALQAKHDDAYIGINDVGSSIYKKVPEGMDKFKDIRMNVPSSATVETLPKIMNKRVLGKDVPNAFNDPFNWLDKKYGKSASLLDESVEKNTPMTINTRSDLIGHDDYINKLDSKLHNVNLYFGPSNPDINRIMNPGIPSSKRLEEALKRLRDAGIRTEVHMDTFPSIKNEEFQKEMKAGFMKMQKDHPGIVIRQNPIKIDAEMEKKFINALGKEWLEGSKK